MEGLEQLVRTPLDREAKKNLRRVARESYKRAHPEFAELLDREGPKLPIHHRRQLEHAHLFPDEDINAHDNLVMVIDDAHDHINALWTRFRQARPQATAQEVDAASRIIEERFRPWYNQPRPPSGVPYSLEEAEATVLEQLKRLFSGLR
jgi:hypothetical protein